MDAGEMKEKKLLSDISRLRAPGAGNTEKSVESVGGE
jgi:hypothetical protein